MNCRLVLDNYWVDAAILELPTMRIDARRDGRLVACGTLDHVTETSGPSRAVAGAALLQCGQSLEAGTGNRCRELVALAEVGTAAA